MAAKKHDTRLLMCVGGNGRSNEFSPMVKSTKARRRFIGNLLKLLFEKGLDGVDYNWEVSRAFSNWQLQYPGYVFGKGYDEEQLLVDMQGFAKLLVCPLFSKEYWIPFKEETYNAFAPLAKTVTLAYYPDKKQETLLTQIKAYNHVDLLHMMTYDQHGRHSTFPFAQAAVDQALSIFPPEAHAKLTLGLPFYGRDVKTGVWKTYEDIVQQNQITPQMDEVSDQYFNGVNTIKEKTQMAFHKKIGGVMIWEVGQDCRVDPVTRSGTTHAKTCPKGKEDSLLNAIAETIAINSQKKKLDFPGDSVHSDLWPLHHHRSLIIINQIPHL